MRGFRRKPIGDILVSMGVITTEQITTALIEQKQSHRKLGELLVAIGQVSEEQVTNARAIQMDVAYIDLQDQLIEPIVLSLINESIARMYKLMPVKLKDDLLTIAMVNPMDVEAIDLIQFESKLRIEPALATDWRIMEAINRHYGNAGSGDLEDFVVQATSHVESITSDVTDELSEDIDRVKRESDQPPIVRMVNLILTQAVRKKASDVHVEPTRNNINVRYRIDGELHLVRSIPKALHPAISSRIKIMSELDISERRLPQDGRITASIDGKSIDLRVSTSPTLFGERIVLRILDRTRSLIPVEQLGFSPRDIDTFNKLITLPYGIILVTGPTGSGKTTTLYAALNSVKSENTNIMTVEDPVEYELEGTSQTNVNQRIGLNFAKQLRSILRQDPDIVLVGEIRDTETADVAFRAALTGHLVFSTLHCNDAPSAITRLIDMDVEPFLVSSAINGVLAQRLVRLLCPDCKLPYKADNDMKFKLGLDPSRDYRVFRAVGCPGCDQTGYKGRTAIREIMVMNDQIRRMAMDKAVASDIRYEAMRSGMTTMRDDGARMIIAGLTTFEEVQRKVFVEVDLDNGHDTKTNVIDIHQEVMQFK
ncbi:MAG: GspE/PulE family protein [Armatimonadota bacterium]